MKVFICLALFAVIAVALAKKESTTALPEVTEVTSMKPDGKPATRDGRYLYIANRGLYDTVYNSYVVVGTPVYQTYVKSYYSYYPSSSYYYTSY